MASGGQWSDIDDDPDDLDGGNSRSGPAADAAKSKPQRRGVSVNQLRRMSGGKMKDSGTSKAKSLPPNIRRSTGPRWSDTTSQTITPPPPVGTRTFSNVHYYTEYPPGHVMTPYENWLEKMITIRRQFLNTTSKDELFNNRFDDYINVLRSVPAKIKLTIHDENIYQIPVFVDDDGKISIHQDIWQAWRDNGGTSVIA